MKRFWLVAAPYTRQLASRARTAHCSRVSNGTHALLRSAARVRRINQFCWWSRALHTNACTANTENLSPVASILSPMLDHIRLSRLFCTSVKIDSCTCPDQKLPKVPKSSNHSVSGHFRYHDNQKFPHFRITCNDLILVVA